MSFAYRSGHRWRAALFIGAMYAGLAAMLAWSFQWPGEGFAQRWGWWLLGLPLWLAAQAVIEFIFSRGLDLDSPFWSRMPSWVRVPLAAALVFACCALGLWVWHFISGRWLT